jgi:nucleoside-diphosphate-sugar epimerase
VAQHLVPALAEQNQVLALTHDEARVPAHGDFETVVVDLRRVDEIELPTVDAIVHLAQANVPFPDGARDLFAVNTASTVSLLEHARTCGASHFVYASSASVYGFGERPWIEDDVPAATDFYSATKLAAERFVGAYEQFFGTTIMRLVAPYGPGQRSRMIPRLIDSVREGRAITLNEGGRPRMNPVFVDDVVALVAAAIESEGHNLVNVSGPDAVSIRELGETIGGVLGREPVFENGTGVAPGDIVCANDRMLETFGLGPLMPLREGIARAAEVPSTA